MKFIKSIITFFVNLFRKKNKNALYEPLKTSFKKPETGKLTVYEWLRKKGYKHTGQHYARLDKPN